MSIIKTISMRSEEESRRGEEHLSVELLKGRGTASCTQVRQGKPGVAWSKNLKVTNVTLPTLLAWRCFSLHLWKGKICGGGLMWGRCGQATRLAGLSERLRRLKAGETGHRVESHKLSSCLIRHDSPHQLLWGTNPLAR